MQDLCELEEFELDVVAGGNPFSNNVTASISAISSTVTITLASAFANTPTSSIAAAIDNSFSISGDSTL